MFNRYWPRRSQVNPVIPETRLVTPGRLGHGARDVVSIISINSWLVVSKCFKPDFYDFP